MVQIYNYVGGGQFPPRMPEGFVQSRFGDIDVVVFVLQDRSNRFSAHVLASLLSNQRGVGGLVYEFSPLNSNFLNVLNYFEIETYPALVLLTFEQFIHFVCMASSTIQTGIVGSISSICNKEKYLVHLLSSNVQFDSETFIGIIQSFLECQLVDSSERNILLKKLNSPIKDTKSLHEFNDHQAKKSIMILLFTHPLDDNSTEFEKSIFESFVKFGRQTDDVLVRVFYPSYIGNQYHDTINQYKVIKLPAMILLDPSKKLVYKVERDVFESIHHFNINLDYVISDIHSAMRSGKPELARQTIEEAKTSNPIFDVRIEKGVVHITSPKVIVSRTNQEKDYTSEPYIRSVIDELISQKEECNDNFFLIHIHRKLKDLIISEMLKLDLDPYGRSDIEISEEMIYGSFKCNQINTIINLLEAI